MQYYYFLHIITKIDILYVRAARLRNECCMSELPPQNYFGRYYGFSVKKYSKIVCKTDRYDFMFYLNIFYGLFHKVVYTSEYYH